jgi:hypothetical protein
MAELPKDEPLVSSAFLWRLNLDRSAERGWVRTDRINTIGRATNAAWMKQGRERRMVMGNTDLNTLHIEFKK